MTESNWKDAFPKENRYFETKNGILYCGDCLKIMKDIPDNSVDLIVIDSPYGLSRGGTPLQQNGLWGGGSWKQVNEKWDIIKDYEEFTLKWLKEIDRIKKDNSSLFVWGSYHNIYKVGYLLQKLNWRIINEIIWYKTDATPNITRRMLVFSHESLIWATKGKWTFNYETAKGFNDNKQLRDVWFSAKTVGIRYKHPTQKPENLTRMIIAIASNEGDIVLDPFLGSGTTAVACRKLNRRWIGVEINPEYCEIAKQRILKVNRTKKIDNYF